MLFSHFIHWGIWSWPAQILITQLLNGILNSLLKPNSVLLHWYHKTESILVAYNHLFSIDKPLRYNMWEKNGKKKYLKLKTIKLGGRVMSDTM